MIDSIKTFALGFEFTSFLALFVYWIPLLVCLTVYLFRAIGKYKQDLKNCTEKYYTPTLTIGWVVGRLLGSIIPVVNLSCMTFDCLASLFKWIDQFLDIPFVRKQPAPEGGE